MRYVVTVERPLDPETEEAVVRVGRRIRRARESAGMTQRRLAELTGVDQATISRLENGLSPFSRLALVARLFVVLDIYQPIRDPVRDRPSMEVGAVLGRL